MRQECSSPSISIIMAAYNEEKNIGKAIESIIGQTFTDWELIVVNDGSEDSTAAVISGYANMCNRIHLLNNNINMGLSASLNIGISMAKGNIIARADADDINMPERLERQYAYMKMHPEIDVLGASVVLLDVDDKRRGILTLPQSHDGLRNLTFLKTHFNHPSVMVRKQFFNKVGMYDLSYSRAQDKELWLRGMRAGCLYANLPEPLIQYKTNGYIRSWKAICNILHSHLRIVHAYRIKYGYALSLISFVISVLIKFKLYKRKSLRGSAFC